MISMLVLDVSTIKKSIQLVGIIFTDRLRRISLQFLGEGRFLSRLALLKSCNVVHIPEVSHFAQGCGREEGLLNSEGILACIS